MPLPKSLRRPVRRASSSLSAGQSVRNLCRTCNNLDARGHAGSVYPDETAKESKAGLTLVIDGLSLSRTKDVSHRGCRFCNVLIQALDVFFDGWRGARGRVQIDIREKGTIKVSIDDERWRGEAIEIYAGSGRYEFQCSIFTHRRIYKCCSEGCRNSMLTYFQPHARPGRPLGQPTISP